MVLGLGGIRRLHFSTEGGYLASRASLREKSGSGCRDGRRDALSRTSPRLPRDLVTTAAPPKIIGLLGCAGIPQHAGRSATRTPASARPGEPGFAYRSRRLRRLTRKYFNIEGPSRPGRGAPQDLHVISGRLSTAWASTRTRLYSAAQFGHLNRSA